MNRIEKSWLYGYILIESVIYICYMTADLMKLEFNTVYIKYVSIIICVIFCLSWKMASLVHCVTYTASGLVGAGLVFTAIADYFLLVQNNHYEIGVSAFIVVQILYMLRLLWQNGLTKRQIIKNVLLGRVLPMALLITVTIIVVTAVPNIPLLPIDQREPLSAQLFLIILVIIYFTNIVANGITACVMSKRYHKLRPFGIGLILFICCDICVGLFNVQNMGVLLPVHLVRFASIGMWAFYLPSQVFITRSAIQCQNISQTEE